MRRRGFTLIELMIVVAVIGAIAAVAAPKFADLRRKAMEGSTKGRLGMIRAATRIYYGRNEGVWPPSLSALLPTFLDVIPASLLYNHPQRNGEWTNGDSPIPDPPPGNDADPGAGWVYNTISGRVWVNCTHTDTKSVTITTW